jgi:hypothetical protein
MAERGGELVTGPSLVIIRIRGSRHRCWQTCSLATKHSTRRRTRWQASSAMPTKLGGLDAVCQGETRAAQQGAWRAAIRAELPPACRARGGTATSLWRTLRSVEATGLHGGLVVAVAIHAAPVTGARDLAAVIEARISRSRAPGHGVLAGATRGGSCRRGAHAAKLRWRHGTRAWRSRRGPRARSIP